MYRHPIPKFSEFHSSLEYFLEKLNEQNQIIIFTVTLILICWKVMLILISTIIQITHLA